MSLCGSFSHSFHEAIHYNGMDIYFQLPSFGKKSGWGTFCLKIDYMLQLKINRHSFCFSVRQPNAQSETYDFSNVNGTSEGPTTEERIQLAFF